MFHYFCRYSSELVTKSKKVRLKFQKQLQKNLRAGFVFTKNPVTIELQWSCILVTSEKPGNFILSKTFGLAYFAPIDATCPPDIKAILKTGEETYRKKLIQKTFAIRARRNKKIQDFNSQKINIALGSKLHPYGKSVDLSNPDITIYIIIQPTGCWFYHKRIPSEKGLPYGTGGKALTLVSGGFDSIVATWLVAKRGVVIEMLLFDLADDAHRQEIIKLLQIFCHIWLPGIRVLLHIVPFQEVASAIAYHVNSSYAQIILKRCFLRVANLLASERSCSAIVMGDSIGQVSSQTLPNIRAIEHVSQEPIIRPLATYDKEEIIQLSRYIGTYAFSAEIEEVCQLVPQKPVTNSSPEKANFYEIDLLKELWEKSFDLRKEVRLDLPMQATVTPTKQIYQVSKDTVIIDCRSPEEMKKRPIKKSISVHFHHLLHTFQSLDKNIDYLIVCQYGIKSAQLAYEMKKVGYRVFASAFHSLSF